MESVADISSQPVAARATGADVRPPPACRGCGAALGTTFVDLGNAPPSNAYVTAAALRETERYYPLHALVCENCFLVQLEAFQTPAEIFSDYAYFSSFSDSWLAHGARFVESICLRERLTASSFVLEIASNDGYLLRRFRERAITVAGIEPARNVARAAVEAGIPTINEFFGAACARALRENGCAPDLVVANNVLAHVPDVHDFLAGLAILLGSTSLATIEVPHLLRLIESLQFDTIYHEHFSYFSLLALEPMFARHGLCVVDVDELTTHGGSVRLYVRHARSGTPGANVERIREDERRAGLDCAQTYRRFGRDVLAVKRRALEFLLGAQARGEIVAAYGAPAKGNTFLGYCGIRSDLIRFTVDRSPHKQGRFLPGSHIPIFEPQAIADVRPNYVLILPWNIADEIKEQMQAVRSWGGRFVTAIPTLTIHP